MKIIAHIRTDFSEKFGIPRQSGLVGELTGRIIFEPEYRTPEAFKGLESFSHIWILWQFSEAKRKRRTDSGEACSDSYWTATVKPPRLGGNRRVGVFATRSPYRPNDIGLSSVQLTGISWDEKLGPVLHVAGADLLDGTPIYDIKPYLPYTDSHPDAAAGFADEVYAHALQVVFPEKLLEKLPETKRQAVIEVLRQDPRPAYQNNPDRKYGVAFAGYDVRFHVSQNVLTVCEVVEI